MPENLTPQGRENQEPRNTGSFKRWYPLENTGAVEAYWEITPEDRRNTETLEVEMMRQTSQAVSAFLEGKK